MGQGYFVEALELRTMFALISPSTISATVSYGQLPDGATDVAKVIWIDNNTEEDGYLVEWSPDGVSNWQQLGSLVGSAPYQATQVLDAGQDYYRQRIQPLGAH